MANKPGGGALKALVAGPLRKEKAFLPNMQEIAKFLLPDTFATNVLETLFLFQ